MSILVTGAAGFIGFHTCHKLLECDQEVIGIDNLTTYYNGQLKEHRLKHLTNYSRFTFLKRSIEDRSTFSFSEPIFDSVDKIIHLAAQAGVQHSLENPHLYVASNLTGHLNILEFARNKTQLKHLVYASSSSVYGNSSVLPLSTDQKADHPVSLYAATKRSGELMAASYSSLYKIPATGLRFFTVYGPWGRPDMSPFIFVHSLFNNIPIKLFNNGLTKRDFTYIDDIVDGIIAALNNPPSGNCPHRLFNLGYGSSVSITDLLDIIENKIGKSAIRKMMPMQTGDVLETFADLNPSMSVLNYFPNVPLEEGISRFVDWYRKFYGHG